MSNPNRDRAKLFLLDIGETPGTPGHEEHVSKLTMLFHLAVVQERDAQREAIRQRDLNDLRSGAPTVSEAVCSCRNILAQDTTRHFRGCPIRQVYPAHEAEKSGG